MYLQTNSYYRLGRVCIFINIFYTTEVQIVLIVYNCKENYQLCILPENFFFFKLYN